MYNTTMLEKFRQWMNFNPPAALDMDGWNDFEDEFRKKAPFRYFIKYAIVLRIDGLFNLLDRKAWKLRNTYIRKYHLVDTKLDYGYHEIDTRMLHANFELLVDYVEIECANIATAFDGEAREKALGWRYKLPPLLRFKEFRSRELGMKHLEWETTLVNPTLSEYERNLGQAQRAVQVIILYTWWKDAYPNRESLACPLEREDDDKPLRFLSAKWKKDNPEKSEAVAQWSKDSFQQELDWDDEDNEMLIALIKIRKGLWT